MTYSDEQINEFLALAQEVGITRAMRELGYPKSWGNGQRWAKLRGIDINADEIMAKAAASREWYKTEELLIVAQEGFNRVHQELVENMNLTADEQKKLSEAFKKYYEVWASANGKATSITETRETSEIDAHIQDLLNSERARNSLKNKSDNTQ